MDVCMMTQKQMMQPQSLNLMNRGKSSLKTKKNARLARQIAEADEVDHEAFNKLVSARVLIPQGDNMSYGNVKRRKRDEDGNLIGHSHSNPMVDTAMTDQLESQENRPSVVQERMKGKLFKKF